LTPSTVEAGGVPLAFDDRGTGPAVVFVHGTAAGRSTWRETIDALGDGVRTIAYDRRGYGDSGAPEPYGGTTVGEQADDLAALIRALDAAPAVLVGHGLGAMVALDVLLREPGLVRGAVLIGTPVLWLSGHGPEVVGELRDAIERGARAGGPAGAVDGYLEHVAGPDAHALYGPDRIDQARGATRAFAADLAAGPSWAATRRELRAVDAPIALVTGTRSSPVDREVAAALAELLHSARSVEVDAGHLAHLERPDVIADEVRAVALPAPPR
jgi:pimeloyl-ACP methyl ester carboxylesterase